MPRKVLAELIGRSEEWLRQIENGQRRLDSIECAVRLSEILRITDLMATLGLGGDEAPRAVSHASMVTPVRRVIMNSLGADIFVGGGEQQEAPEWLEAAVDEAWLRWFDGPGRYQKTLRRLPDLLRPATVQLRSENVAAQLEPAVAAYHLARTVLSRMGEVQLAWIGADRAMTAAAQTGGPILLTAAWHTCACYIQQGCFQEAHRLATAAINSYHSAARSSTDILALTGAMRLLAAEAAGGMLESQEAHTLLEQARRTADELAGDGRPYRIAFGRVEVGISTVHVAMRLGRTNEAIRLAAEVDIPDHYPSDRQARYYIPLASLHARRNEDAAAVFALVKVSVISPEDLRYDELSYNTLHRLLRRNNLTVRKELSRLTHIAGIV